MYAKAIERISQEIVNTYVAEMKKIPDHLSEDFNNIFMQNIKNFNQKIDNEIKSFKLELKEQKKQHHKMLINVFFISLILQLPVVIFWIFTFKFFR